MLKKKILSLAIAAAFSLGSCGYAAPLSPEDAARLSQPHPRLFYLVSATVDFNLAEQIKRAYALIDSGQDYPMAIAILNKVVELDNNNAEAYLLRGIAKTRQIDAGEGNSSNKYKIDEDYKAALMIEPDNPTFFFYRGENRRLVDKSYSRSREMYKKALELAPNYLDAMVGVGDAYYDEGESYFQKCKENETYRRLYGYDESAITSYTKAIEEYNKVLVMVPAHGTVTAKKEMAQERLKEVRAMSEEAKRKAEITRRIG